MKTLQEIAREMTADYAGQRDDVVLSRHYFAEALREAIETDRAQRDTYELADHVEAMKKYLKENELPDMTRRAFIADLYDVLREVGEDV